MIKKRFLLLLLTSALGYCATAQPACTASLRNNFITVLQNRTLILTHIEKLKTDTHPTCMAYRGLLRAQMSKEVNWPPDKYSYFEKSKLDIDSAIKADPANAEARLMRLLVQANAPKFLGYHNNIDEDTNKLMSHLREGTSSNKDIMLFIINRLLETNSVTQTHGKELQKLKQKFS